MPFKNFNFVWTLNSAPLKYAFHQQLDNNFCASEDENSMYSICFFQLYCSSYLGALVFPIKLFYLFCSS